MGKISVPDIKNLGLDPCLFKILDPPRQRARKGASAYISHSFSGACFVPQCVILVLNHSARQICNFSAELLKAHL